MKKRYIAIPVVIAALIVGFVLFVRTKNIKTLDQEVYKIKQMDINSEEVDMSLYCSGDYMAVEDTIKTYTKKYLDTIKEFKNEINDDRLNNLLSIASITADRPSFTKSEIFLTQKLDKIQEDSRIIIEMGKEDTIRKAIDESNVGNSFKDLFMEKMTHALGSDFFVTEKDVTTIRDDMYEKIENFKKVVELLKNNTGRWNTDNNILQFDNEELLNQYNTLTAAINGQ